MIFIKLPMKNRIEDAENFKTQSTEPVCISVSPASIQSIRRLTQRI